MPGMVLMFWTATALDPAPIVAVGMTPMVSYPDASIKRMIPPNLKECLPLIQLRSSPYWKFSVMRLLVELELLGAGESVDLPLKVSGIRCLWTVRLKLGYRGVRTFECIFGSF